MDAMKNGRELTDDAMNEVTGGVFVENSFSTENVPHCKLCDDEVEYTGDIRLEGGLTGQYKCKNRLCQNCINKKTLDNLDIYWAPPAGKK